VLVDQRTIQPEILATPALYSLLLIIHNPTNRMLKENYYFFKEKISLGNHDQNSAKALWRLCFALV
jgi:hypothetical protein